MSPWLQLHRLLSDEELVRLLLCCDGPVIAASATPLFDYLIRFLRPSCLVLFFDYLLDVSEIDKETEEAAVDGRTTASIDDPRQKEAEENAPKKEVRAVFGRVNDETVRLFTFSLRNDRRRLKQLLVQTMPSAKERLRSFEEGEQPRPASDGDVAKDGREKEGSAEKQVGQGSDSGSAVNAADGEGKPNAPTRGAAAAKAYFHSSAAVAQEKITAFGLRLYSKFFGGTGKDQSEERRERAAEERQTTVELDENKEDGAVSNSAPALSSSSSTFWHFTLSLILRLLELAAHGCVEATSSRQRFVLGCLAEKAASLSANAPSTLPAEALRRGFEESGLELLWAAGQVGLGRLSDAFVAAVSALSRRHSAFRFGKRGEERDDGGLDGLSRGAASLLRAIVGLPATRPLGVAPFVWECFVSFCGEACSSCLDRKAGAASPMTGLVTGQSANRDSVGEGVGVGFVTSRGRLLEVASEVWMTLSLSVQAFEEVLEEIR